MIDDSNLFLWAQDSCQIHHSSFIWSTNERSSTLKDEAGGTIWFMTSGTSLIGNAGDSLGPWPIFTTLDLAANTLLSSPNVVDVSHGASGTTFVRSVPVKDVDFSELLHLFCTWLWKAVDISCTLMYIREMGT